MKLKITNPSQEASPYLRDLIYKFWLQGFRFNSLAGLQIMHKVIFFHFQISEQVKNGCNYYKLKSGKSAISSFKSQLRVLCISTIFCSFSDIFCWFQPWNHWKRFEMNKKGWKRLEKSSSTSLRVLQAPKSWSKYTTYTHNFIRQKNK